jgi:ABC-2 type transport system permease protein
MINAIRADFYRLFHTKGFYITQISLIALVVLVVLTQALGSTGVSSEQLTQLQHGFYDSRWNGYQTVIAISSMASFLIYFCLPLFTMIIGHDLTKKTYKNQLAIGVSRLYFFVSKYLIFLLVSALQFAFYYIFTFLAGIVRYGLGTPPENFWSNILRTVGIQFLSLQALFAIALLLLCLAFSNVFAVIGVIISGLVLSIPQAVFPKVEWVKYLDFQSNINLAWVTNVPEHYWLKTTVTAVCFTIILAILAYQSLRKRDL